MLPFKMNSAEFGKAVRRALEPARGTYIYDAAIRDLESKTSPGDPCGYQAWLGRLLEFAENRHGNRIRVLDLGCGNGELTVMMNLLGYDVVGVDVNERAVKLARTLATENGIDPSRILLTDGARLPFDDESFQLITMISSLEHINDDALAALVPEVARVCGDILFVQVPSAMKVSDDHTGLKIVPWMPPRWAEIYIRFRGLRYQYRISDSRKWDVVYRNLDQVYAQFNACFTAEFAAPEISYPAWRPDDAVLSLGKALRFRDREYRLALPLPGRRLARARGKPLEHFLPYYNVVFHKR